MKIPDRLVGYLEDLAALGYFGKTTGDVARHFIERGIERSVYDGFIEIQDWNARANPAGVPTPNVHEVGS